MRSFTDYLGYNDRESKKKLTLLGNILEKSGYKVSKHTEDRKEPYLYIHKPDHIDAILENLSFGGIRIYIRGKDMVCFRPQNESKVEPFGTTYHLDLKTMFRDLLKETHKKSKIGHEMIKFIMEEIKDFFIQSAKAEREDMPEPTDSQMGAVVNASVPDFADMNADSRNSRN